MKAPRSDPSRLRDCLVKPLWWEDVPPPEPIDAPLPTNVDLLIVGSGYTGLAAARVVAAAGRSTLVVDAEALGFGCSTRNGGSVSPGIKPSLAELTKRLGATAAAAIRGEASDALANVAEIATAPGVAVDWHPNGRFYATHTPRQYRLLEREIASIAPSGRDMRLVPAERLHEELAADRFHGGLVTMDGALVHPAKLHRHMLGLAKAAGAKFSDHNPVEAIGGDAGQFTVRTRRGTVTARDVLIATNGYTGYLSPWHRRRVIPIASNMLATEPLPPDRVKELIPNNRSIIDSRKVVAYFRQSPDGRRIVYGGRAALRNNDPLQNLPRLHEMMLQVFPRLADVAISHSWSGTVAYTFDKLPHLGTHQGVHFCMGYCGTGIAPSLHFGRRIGQQILGLPAGRTAVDDLQFQTRPLYGGVPWFLAPSIAFYRTMDRYFS